MTARPPDFEPLAATDPVPGEPQAIASLGRRYSDTASEIQQQATNLRRLAEGSRAGWKGKSGTVFASKAEDLATRITRAHARYAAAGQALTACAAPMGDAQDRAYAAVWKAKDAGQRMQANAAATAITGAPIHPNDPAVRARTARYDQAQTDLATARRQFTTAVEDYTAAANQAARAITAELSTDPLKDSWWDANFGWISHLFEYISIAIIVLAVISLILICPLAAGLLGAALAEGLSTYIGATLVALTVFQTVFDSTAMATHKASWVAFAADIAALATFGFGKVAEALVKSAAEGAASTGKVVAFVRAGRDALRSNHLPGFLFSLATRNALASTLMRGIGLVRQPPIAV